MDHPDILDFIDCKKNNADITNPNISVGITEDFMKAVEQDADYDLIDPTPKRWWDIFPPKRSLTRS